MISTRIKILIPISALLILLCSSLLQAQSILQPLASVVHEQVDNHTSLLLCSDNPEDFIEAIIQAITSTPSLDYKRLTNKESPTPSFASYNRIAAYDVGSTGTKITIADVNARAPSQFIIIDRMVMDTPFEITPESIPNRLLLYKEIKTCIDSVYSSKSNPVFHYARATAGFRNAKDLGFELAMKIRTLSGINFKVAPQTKEGWFSYESVARSLDTSPDGLVVWDVGGGSIQVTTQDEHKLYATIGSGYASRSIIPLINEKVKKSPDLHAPLYPMSFNEILQAIDLVSALNAHGQYEDHINSTYFFENQEAVEKIKNQIKNHNVVYGVGAFHNQSIQRYVAPGKNYYTREQIKTLLIKLSNQTQQSAEDLLDGHNNEFFQYLLSDLILTYSTMQTLGIDQVYTLPVDNGIGLVHLGHQKWMDTTITAKNPQIPLAEVYCLAH